ncbi:MAG: hypothetical protein LBJ70_00100 [Holosporales bacterium]|jgi:hypothetical protein|nr:hypothetical protein [Holosporales bacterium]
MNRSTKKLLLITATLFSFLPKGEGMYHTNIVAIAEEQRIHEAVDDPASVKSMSRHFVNNKADIGGIISCPEVIEEPFFSISLLGGKAPMRFVHGVVQRAFAEVKLDSPSCPCVFGWKSVSIPDLSDPDVRIPTTKFELRGSLIGIKERYRFYLFSHGEKVAKVKDGQLYKFDAAGKAHRVEDFSEERDMELRMHLRCYVDSDGKILATKNTLFATLSEECRAEVFRPEEEETQFSHLVHFIETTYTGDAYHWVQDRQEDLYDLVYKFREELPKGANPQRALLRVTGHALGKKIGREEQQELCGHILSLLH